MAEYNRDEMKELTDNGLLEIAGLVNRREYNLSLIKSRQLAEQLVKSYAEEKGIEYTGLADTIEALFQNGAIDRTSRDAFHNIRVYGNNAVHEGDEDPEDAQKAYYLVKNEVQTFLSHRAVSVDRTPVRIDREQVASGRRPAYPDGSQGRAGGRSGQGQQRNRRKKGEPERGGRSGRQSQVRNAEQGFGATEIVGGFTVYDLLRILIPVVAIILLLFIIRSLLPSKTKDQPTTAAPTAAVESVQSETPAEQQPETEAPTEAPTEAQSVEYRVKGNGVNVRYAENQDRIYTQLSNGTAIGTVTEIEGSDFVQFTLDGINVVINKNFIEPIQ